VKLDFFSPKEAAPWAASRRGSRRYSLLNMAFDAPTGGILGTSFGAVDAVDTMPQKGKSQAREAAQVVKKYLEQHKTFKLPGPK